MPSAVHEMYPRTTQRYLMTCQGDAYANENIMIICLLVHLKAIMIYRQKTLLVFRSTGQIRSWFQIRICQKGKFMAKFRVHKRGQ